MVDKKNRLRTELFITGIIDDNVSNKFIEETQDIIDEFTSYKMETSYIKEIMQQKFPMITVTINSPGGNIYDGNLIISRIKEMQELGIPLIANGITCMSMAFIIYIAFNKRTADLTARSASNFSFSFANIACLMSAFIFSSNSMVYFIGLN